jgi:DNA end-binding protein Ku
MKAVWSGILSFGLINIPVKLYGASKERALKFQLLDKKDKCPISYKKVCRLDNKVVNQKDIVKGYEYEKGVYVIVTTEDFKRANILKTDRIEIVKFSQKEDIDPMYYSKPYYIEPDKKAGAAYMLLHKVLEQTNKIGIAKFIIKDKEHIGVLKTEGSFLMLIELRFEDEIVPPKELNTPHRAKFSQTELEVALDLVNKLTEKFDPKDFKDTYTDELKKVIEEKAKGIKSKPKSRTKPVPTDMADLLVMLKKSLE